MITDLSLIVTLRGPDPVALTAHRALTHRLGYQDLVTVLERRDLWWLSVEASGVAEAVSLVGSWVTRSNLFVNPNKHDYQLSATRGGGSGRAVSRSARVAWVVAASDPDIEGRAAVHMIHTRFRGRELMEARKAVLWKLRFGSTVDPAEVPRLAAEIGTSRARLRGLLTNPQFQSARVVRARTPEEAAQAVFAADPEAGDPDRTESECAD